MYDLAEQEIKNRKGTTICIRGGEVNNIVFLLLNTRLFYIFRIGHSLILFISPYTDSDSAYRIEFYKKKRLKKLRQKEAGKRETKMEWKLKEEEFYFF